MHPQALLHYQITKQLGQGGMGEVYLARDTQLGREVALKVLPPELAHDTERLARFKQEARAVAALSHPNIVTVHSVETDHDTHFITMELVRGERLTDLITTGGLPIARVLEIAIPLCDAVAAAHKQGITHRDLKPDNIMIDEDGRLKVLDFGIAKVEATPAGAQQGTAETADVVRTPTAAGSLIGTVAYMSPEQAEGKPVGPTSDVFSLGIVLYEMATGQRPFDGDTNISILTAIMRDTPTPASGSGHRVPSLFDQILGRCLQKDPGDRYPDAGQLRDDLRTLRAQVAPEAVSRRQRVRAGAAIAGVLAVAAVGAAIWLSRQNARVQWARTEALPTIESLLEQTSYLERGTTGWDARDLALQAADIIPDDPALGALQPRLGREVTITTDPPGATIFGAPYTTPDGPWRELGRAPLENIRIPFGSNRIRVELDGHASIVDLRLNSGLSDGLWAYTLSRPDELPDGMVRVAGGQRDLRLPGLDHIEPQEIAPFLIDRHEVTNAEYKAFVDAGGYTNPDFWTEPFLEEGRALTFDEGVSRFRDATGQPGPALWEVGDYPEGMDDHPVAGISWYEAAAYAAFVGKSLPTLYHWNQVAETYASGEIIPLSNFSGDGTTPVGSRNALHRNGAQDLAGNVREWCLNANTLDNQRFILGGGWNDNGYAFNDAYAQSPWDRSPTNGVRCMRYLDPADERASLTATIEMPFRDFYAEEPVSDETFEIYLRQFAYDAAPLNARIEREDDFEDWTRQLVTFDAAYGDDERVMAYVFLPKGEAGPYPSVVIFPGSNAIHTESSEGVDGSWFDFLLKSGRAVVLPIYKGTYERGTDLDSDYPEETQFYKEHVIMWAKDLGRTIDYLESREDLDTSGLAYIGLSWGGAMGAIMPAVESRIRCNVLVVAGFCFQRALPEVDQLTYAPRVTQPTVMINGEFDFFFPIETSQKPLHDLLGTPEELKKYVVFPGSHSIPRTGMIRETLGWLDRHQGPGG